MGFKRLQKYVVLLFYLFLISGTSTAERPSSEATKGSKKLEYQETQIPFSHPSSITQRDTTPGGVPVINPTTPGTSPIVNPTNPQPPATTNSAPAGGSWCIAIPTASETALQVALDYACGYGGADCSAIQPGASCFDPNTVRDHASYAFNDYYQKNPIPTSCVFGGTAQLSNTDPSNGNCRYASPTSTPTMTPTVPLTPTVPMTPPSPTMPVNPYTPGAGGGYGSEPGYDYGSEPTESPNSAETISHKHQLLIATNCLIFLFVQINYLC